jgi:phenylpyruvate tautomerase PptA (4-oxalocrotonate tautomerase family)
VLINEVPDGGWGMAGPAITLEQMRAALGAR